MHSRVLVRTDSLSKLLSPLPTPPGRTGKNRGLLFEPLLLPKTLNATCTLCRVW